MKSAHEQAWVQTCQRARHAPYARRVKSARLNWIWFQPSSSRMGMVQMKGFTRVVDCTAQSYPGQLKQERRPADDRPQKARQAYTSHGTLLLEGRAVREGQGCESARCSLRGQTAAREAAPALGEVHLVVGRAKAPPHVLVVEHLHLEAEVLLQVFYNHHQKGQLDAQRLLRVRRAGDVGGADVGRHHLKHAAGYVVIRDALYVAVPHCAVPQPGLSLASASRGASSCHTAVEELKAAQLCHSQRQARCGMWRGPITFCCPYLQRPASQRVQNGQKAALKGVVEHLAAQLSPCYFQHETYVV